MAKRLTSHSAADGKQCACASCRSNVRPRSQTNRPTGAQSPTDILVSDTFGDITKDYINWPSNDTLTYHIYDREGRARGAVTNEHTIIEEEFINTTVSGVDDVIQLDFEQSSSVSNSQVVFVSVDSYRPWSAGVVGQVVETKNKWFVLWKDSTPNSDVLTEFDQNTITHEFGHSLGLSHPNERPTDPAYNTVEDTVMSYNDLNGQWGTSFTANDYTALTSIWGAETSI